MMRKTFWRSFIFVPIINPNPPQATPFEELPYCCIQTSVSSTCGPEQLACRRYKGQSVLHSSEEALTVVTRRRTEHHFTPRSGGGSPPDHAGSWIAHGKVVFSIPDTPCMSYLPTIWQWGGGISVVNVGFQYASPRQVVESASQEP